MKNDEPERMSMPEVYSRRKLNALYREIPLKDTVSRELRKYFNAMAGLYGVIKLKKAYEIISSQRPNLVTKDEFAAFAEIARHECEGYYILGDDEMFIDGKTKSIFDREIIDFNLFDLDFDDYLNLKARQRGKPYYVPDKSEFMLYANEFYCEETPEYLEIKKYLKLKFRLDDFDLGEAMWGVVFSSKYFDDPFSEVSGYLTDMGLVFKTDADAQKFFMLLQDFYNNLRMQCNRGHTPMETAKFLPKGENAPKSVSFGPNIKNGIADGSIDPDDLRREVLLMDLPNEELRFMLLQEISEAELAVRKGKKPGKIGRNDPCPCGSGKKYKKCCGKNK